MAPVGEKEGSAKAPYKFSLADTVDTRNRPGVRLPVPCDCQRLDLVSEAII